VAIVALVALAYLVFRGGGGGGILSDGGPDNTIPAFEFAQGKTSAVFVTNEKKSKPPASATAAAADVTSTLHDLYTEAFLDPANWRDGSYDEVWPLFSDGASGAAQQDAATLTVGAAGGQTFEKIADPKGRVEVKVLLDDQERVATVVAVVRFSAVGTRKDGKLTIFRSSGQYFLLPGGDGWQVYSFSVDRDDQVREPKPSPSAGGSAGASS
jgi:hypothetical protein